MRIHLNLVLLSTLLIPAASHAQELPLDRAVVLTEANWRNLDYAPWNPADMDRLRKETGLIGPGPSTPFPENKVFFRTGGRTLARASLRHQGKKLVGNYTYVNHYDLMSQVPSVPVDVCSKAS